jgi:hypothetical protein
MQNSKNDHKNSAGEIVTQHLTERPQLPLDLFLDEADDQGPEKSLVGISLSTCI